MLDLVLRVSFYKFIAAFAREFLILIAETLKLEVHSIAVNGLVPILNFQLIQMVEGDYFQVTLLTLNFILIFNIKYN